MNILQKIRVEKITLNIGAGADQERLKKAVKLLQNLSGMTPVKTLSNKRIPSWGVRPGLPLGCKVTVRGKNAETLLKRLLKAKDGQLKKSYFDNFGNVSFGIHEYIDVPDFSYDASLGIMGFQVSVTLSRPGYRIKNRRKKKVIGKKHKINQEDAIKFFNEVYKIEVN